MITLLMSILILAQNPPQASDPGAPPPPEGWKLDDTSKNGPLTVPLGKPQKKSPRLKKKIVPLPDSKPENRG